jgi:hypothetical protein
MDKVCNYLKRNLEIKRPYHPPAFPSERRDRQMICDKCFWKENGFCDEGYFDNDKERERCLDFIELQKEEGMQT